MKHHILKHHAVLEGNVQAFSRDEVDFELSEICAPRLARIARSETRADKLCWCKSETFVCYGLYYLPELWIYHVK